MPSLLAAPFNWPLILTFVFLFYFLGDFLNTIFQNSTGFVYLCYVIFISKSNFTYSQRCPF